METIVYVIPGEHTIETRVMAMSGGGGALMVLAASKSAERNKKSLNIDVQANKNYLISAKAIDFSLGTPTAFDYTYDEFEGSESPEIEVDY